MSRTAPFSDQAAKDELRRIISGFANVLPEDVRLDTDITTIFGLDFLDRLCVIVDAELLLSIDLGKDAEDSIRTINDIMNVYRETYQIGDDGEVQA
jgi:acyl carrier protein